MIAEKKKRKTKRLSKSEEEKRAHLLSHILDKWVCVRDNYSDDRKFYFVKHVIGERGKTSRIKQYIISGYEEQDGEYEISDYEIGYIFNSHTMKKMVEIKPIKFDLKYGLYSENRFAETYDELLNYLKDKGIVNDLELHGMLKMNNYHQGMDEIKITHVRNYRSVSQGGEV